MKEIKRLLHKNLFIFSMVILILSVISCQGVSVPIQVTSSNVTYDEFVQIRAAILNYNQVQRSDASLYSSPSSARSINPQLQAKDYDFYLYGQKKTTDFNNQTFGPYRVNVTADSNGDSGSFATQIPVGTWYLTLAAFKSETPESSITGNSLNSSALLIGYTMADFTQSNPSVNFTLNASGLTTPGKVNLKINLQNWKLSDFDSNMKVKAELIKNNTSLSAVNALVKDNDTYLEYKPSDDIDPGIYQFKLTFYNFTDTTNSFIWSDKLTVYPGTETNQDVFVPQVMNAVPENPVDFKFTLNDTSSINGSSDYYSGTFSWDLPEGGTTATEYELMLYDSVENKEYITYTTKNQGSILCKAGSLNVPSTSITLWLPLGKNLSAKLRAKNKTGTSAWATTKLDNTKRSIDNIYVYRVTYNLQSGFTQDDSVFGTDTTGQSGEFYYYGSSSNNHTWITPSSDKIKTSDNKTFDYWSLSPSEGAAKFDTTANAGKYSGHENIELYAHYKTNVSHPLDPSANQGAGKSLSISYGSSETPLPDDHIITLSSGTNLSLTITTENFNYSNITTYGSWYTQEYLNNNGPSQFTINGNKYSYEYTTPSETGTYTVFIEAQFNNVETASTEISKLNLTLIIQ